MIAVVASSSAYLEFVAARARPNTLLATAYLKVFFSVVAKDPVEVTTADIFEFITSQRGDRRVVRISDGWSGLSPRTLTVGLGIFYIILCPPQLLPQRENS